MTDTKSKHFQCRHIFADGHRCGSKCLRAENFCFYHYRSHKPRILPDCTVANFPFDLPAFEDRSSIQAAITMVAQRVASCNLDSKRAGLLLYAAQIASLNLPKPAAEPLESVTETELDDSGAMIAPITEILPDPEDRFSPRAMLARWEEECREEDEIARKSALFLAILKNQAAAENFTLPKDLPDILPHLEAVAGEASPEGAGPKSRHNRLPARVALTAQGICPESTNAGSGHHKPSRASRIPERRLYQGKPRPRPYRSVFLRQNPCSAFLPLPQKPYLFPCAESSPLGVESKQYVRRDAAPQPNRRSQRLTSVMRPTRRTRFRFTRNTRNFA